MKGRNITIVGIVACSLAALLFVFLKFIDYRTLTLAGGILFVLAGLLDIAFYNTKGREGLAPVMGAVTDMGCIMLGMAMLVFSAEFVIMTTFMLGLAVAIMALWQFFILAVGARPYQLPTWLYIFPVILVGASIYIFVCRQNDYTTPLIITTGMALAIVGCGCLIEGSILGVARRNYIKAQQESAAKAAETQAAAQTTSQAATQATSSQTLAQPAANSISIDFDDDEPQIATPQTTKPANKPIETTDDLDDEIIE